MERCRTVAGLRQALAPARREGRSVGFVPTMGALHDGHLALVKAATGASDVTVVSIFVNPTQFGPGEDLEAYPRDLERDEHLLGSLPKPPQLVFAPTADEMYPGERLTTVHVERLTAVLCGRSRPGHFDGVTTVVTKLLNIVQPDAVWFGRKDFQQLAVIRRLVADLDLPVTVHGVPTVREDDGVALSSRNAYLDEADRLAARSLSQGLRAATLAARQARSEGRRPAADVLRDSVIDTLAPQSRVQIDYVEVLDPDALMPPDDPTAGQPHHVRPEDRGEGGDKPTGSGDRHRLLVAVAAHVGSSSRTTRLIDNVVVGDAADEVALLSATDEARKSAVQPAPATTDDERGT